MAQASRRIRKIRRLKNERRLAYKMMNHALRERDFFRAVLVELKKTEDELQAKKEAESKAEVPVE